MTSKTLVSSAGLMAALVLAGCAHNAPAPGAAPVNPIAPVALPKTSPEAQAAFDEGVRVMRMGRRHYKEAVEPFTRATRLDPRLYEAWHDLGVIHTATGDLDAAVDDFKRALDIQPGARKTVLAYGESLRRNHEPEEGGRRLRAVAELRSRRLRDARALQPGVARIRQRFAGRGAGTGAPLACFCGWERVAHGNCL